MFTAGWLSWSTAYENLRWMALGAKGPPWPQKIFVGFFFWLGRTNYSMMPKIAVAFSMNFSAEAITALAPD